MEVRWINDVYFKFAAADRGVSVRRGHSDNDLIGNTDNKEITTATQRAGNNLLLLFIVKYYFPFRAKPARPLYCI